MRGTTMRTKQEIINELNKYSTTLYHKTKIEILTDIRDTLTKINDRLKK